MNSDEATVAVIDALQALDIPYILVGSLASNLYGIPRSTKDADFSVQERQKERQKVPATKFGQYTSSW